MEKPILQDVRKTITLELPSFKGSVVVLWEQRLAKDTADLEEIKSGYKLGILTLRHLIKEWNLVTKEGITAPINEYSLGRLPEKDMLFLVEKIGKLIAAADEKKKMNSKK